MLPSANILAQNFMNFKQFLKPDWRKILIFVIFFALSYLRKSAGTIPALGYLFLYHGFPFYYFSIWLNFNVVWKIKILWVGLLIDVVFWYLFSCFIIWIYDKVKKKEVKQINS